MLLCVQVAVILLLPATPLAAHDNPALGCTFHGLAVLYNVKTMTYEAVQLTKIGRNRK